MNEKSNQSIKSHNVAILILTVSCLGCMFECVSQGWELWTIPLISLGVITCWFFHLTHYKEATFRENFYIILAMLVSFYHGVHTTSFFDLVVVSFLVLVTAAVVGRKEYMPLIFVEFNILLIGQVIYAITHGTVEFDSLTISRIMLHGGTEACIYKALVEMMNYAERADKKLGTMQKSEESDRIGMEDFLVNISHELRTPVNVINGMSTLILKKETREDVLSIRDAGLRLSHQIEDIQDYSEIQRGDALLEIDKYSITSLLNDLTSNFNNMSQRRNLEVVIDLDPDVPTILRGDVKKIKKIITHLIDNGFKFTREGGVNLRVSSIKRDYGVNLVIEVSDTGIGMTENDKEKVSLGNYQANKKRNRSTGGIGLGLSIVYGFTRLMDGFVSIESTRKKGTIVRVSIVQEVLDPSPCLSVGGDRFLGIVFHVFPEKFKVAGVRNYYTAMASHMAMGLRQNLYSAPNLRELKGLLETGSITHVFMGAEEYNGDPGFFEELAKTDVSVVVCADNTFSVPKTSAVIVMPKPLYGYPVTKILNGDTETDDIFVTDEKRNLDLDGVRALIVDDEPMNLVVATGLLKEYNMIIDTAESGKQALQKYDTGDYDVVFMDHMMPEMDGVEAMKKLRFIADQKGKKLKVVALTANAISGAREMFLREGFDGFISKPIYINDFERVMSRVMSDGRAI